MYTNTAFFFIKELKYNNYIKLVIHYAVTVLITILETYNITQDLGPTAYRDQFLNYTGIYFIIAVCFLVRVKLKNRNKSKYINYEKAINKE
ncbi:hypothetical protein GCM10008904_32610 [Paraclostridium ghonii]|uniref:VanZ-like domain-containing protein n=1 Tax=Paraclostridium ghonii TaxID=29358 RepID=A0ABU0N4C5_9FIRM|nr:DUF6608 family protein [Paeniclostridium ghonii]MDQ0558012.1 hypothetical protein [Paeniclostridium ghonii]